MFLKISCLVRQMIKKPQLIQVSFSSRIMISAAFLITVFEQILFESNVTQSFDE